MSPLASRALLLASLVAIAAAPGCSNPTAGTVDTGHGATDGGGTDGGGADGGGGGDTGTDGGNLDVDGGDTDGGGTTSDSGTDGGATGTDAGAAGCLFHGRYLATNIRCNGVAYTGAAALMPPAGSWIATDDGTHATFTQTIGSCSLIATGHIDCDSPATGQFTHHPDAPLTCSPDHCTPFAAACTGTTVGADATWTYVRNADGSIEASTGATAIRTCTAAGQSNPVQITWVPN